MKITIILILLIVIGVNCDLNSHDRINDKDPVSSSFEDVTLPTIAGVVPENGTTVDVTIAIQVNL